MTLAANFLTTANAVYTHPSGRSYTANSSGVLSVPYPDGGNMPGAQVDLPLLWLSGTTTDRLTLNVSATNPQPPPFRVAFNDSTLSAYAFWVGPALSSTQWVNASGSAV